MACSTVSWRSLAPPKNLRVGASLRLARVRGPASNLPTLPNVKLAPAFFPKVSFWQRRPPRRPAGAEIPAVLSVAEAESPSFCQLTLQPDREQRLLGFAGEMSASGDRKYQPGELLCNGAAALPRAPPPGPGNCAQARRVKFPEKIHRPPVADKTAGPSICDNGPGPRCGGRSCAVSLSPLNTPAASQRARPLALSMVNPRSGSAQTCRPPRSQCGDAVQDHSEQQQPRQSASDANKILCAKFSRREGRGPKPCPASNSPPCFRNQISRSKAGGR